MIAAEVHRRAAPHSKLRDGAGLQAAAGAYKAVVGIPVVGPILAPIAAGVAFTAVEAFDSLTSAQGGQWQVPFDGQLTELHRDESVLSANIANPMRHFFESGGGGSRGGDVHLHYNPIVSGQDTPNMRAILESHTGHCAHLEKRAP
jgi:hypothetical protein